MKGETERRGRNTGTGHRTSPLATCGTSTVFHQEVVHGREVHLDLIAEREKKRQRRQKQTTTRTLRKRKNISSSLAAGASKANRDLQNKSGASRFSSTCRLRGEPDVHIRDDPVQTHASSCTCSPSSSCSISTEPSRSLDEQQTRLVLVLLLLSRPSPRPSPRRLVLLLHRAKRHLRLPRRTRRRDRFDEYDGGLRLACLVLL